MYHRVTESKKKIYIKDKAIKDYEKKKTEEKAIKTPVPTIRGRKPRTTQSKKGALKIALSKWKNLLLKLLKISLFIMDWPSKDVLIH